MSLLSGQEGEQEKMARFQCFQIQMTSILTKHKIANIKRACQSPMIAAATAREMGCAASPLRALHHPVPEGRVPVPVPVPKSIALRRKGTSDRVQEFEGGREMGSLLGYVWKSILGRWR